MKEILINRTQGSERRATATLQATPLFPAAILEGRAMEKMIWVSRHDLTNGQVSCLPALGYKGWERKSISFGENPERDMCEALCPDAGVDSCKDCQFSQQRDGGCCEAGIVAPLHVGLDLLRAGWTLIEFVNVPSARTRGVFVCQGAYRHTLAKSTFFPCPLSAEEQEEGSLSPMKGGDK